MTKVEAALEAFYLPAEPDSRFVLFRPGQGDVLHGAFVYVHPFAEELNKSRRMAALQDRAFARAGFAVMRIDLYGCGDSGGDLVDARWDIWKRDLEIATDWLSQKVRAPIHLWGLRLGAALAIAAWQQMRHRVSSALLWQPVVEGRSFMTQFLRLAVARNALRESVGTVTTDMLRSQLTNGASVEVAGYEIAPELAMAIDRERLDEYVPSGPVHWIDARTAVGSPPGPVQATLDKWRANGVPLSYRCVASPPFWSSVEIEEVPELIQLTTEAYASSR